MHPVVEETARAIKELRIQGAKQVAERAVAAIYAMLLDSRYTEREALERDVIEAVKVLAKTRPTEPALREALAYVLRSLSRHRDLPPQVLQEALISDLEGFAREMRAVEERIASIGASLIEEGATIITHCHSSTLMGIFREAAKQRSFHVIVTETRPKLQGLKTARELLQMGVEVTYIVDSAAYYFMRDADLYMTGADVITADGKVINKVGTALIALAAHEFGVPFYVAASSYKFDPITVLGMREPIEERDPAEVIEPSQLPGARIRNPAFDATPAHLVTAIVSEFGVYNVYTFISVVSERRKIDPSLEQVISFAFRR